MFENAKGFDKKFLGLSVGPLEFDFEAPATVKQVSMAEITKATGLRFPDLV